MPAYRLDLRPDPTTRQGTDGSILDLLARDKDFAVLAPRLPRFEDGDVDLRPYCTNSDQGSIGSCAGNATADAVEILNALEEEAKTGRVPEKPTQLSRMFVYALARNLLDENGDGQGDIGRDEGSYIRLCFEVLSRYGICDETVWPYDPSKVFTLPSIKAMRQAVGHKIHDYYRIKASGPGRLDAVRWSLRARQPVVFGTSIESSFFKVSSGTPIGPPRGATVGAHAMVVVGLLGEDFLVKNSWGPFWGDDGYWVMRADYLAWEATTDLWVPTRGSLFT
jgi:Papain family cysteine protease